MEFMIHDKHINFFLQFAKRGLKLFLTIRRYFLDYFWGNYSSFESLILESCNRNTCNRTLVSGNTSTFLSQVVFGNVLIYLSEFPTCLSVWWLCWYVIWKIVGFCWFRFQETSNILSYLPDRTKLATELFVNDSLIAIRSESFIYYRQEPSQCLLVLLKTWCFQ